MESFPYRSLDDVKQFLQLNSRNETYPWLNNVRELEPASSTCFIDEDSPQDTWIPKQRLARGSVPKSLFCHDFKGGYLDDRFVYGSTKHDSYVFYNWSCVDIFVYFSHHFVTVPPPVWVNASHLHGVPILGTLITEWRNGETLWDQVLDEPYKVTWLAESLADIAKFHKFDGYLLNIENKLKKDQIKPMIQFIKSLKQFLDLKKGKNNYLIWYDSVTVEGDLKWQNELNIKNYAFFDCCDGIFLNYSWSEANLDNTLKMAGERVHDIYVGVDVFGRNFYQGGGYNTDKALDIISQRKLSCALFAFGWTYEVLNGDFNINDQLFWERVWKYFHMHGVKSLPFSTNFCRGYGSKYYVNGKVESGPWYNLSKQSYQVSNPMLFRSNKFSDEIVLIHKEIVRTCSTSYSAVGSLSKMCKYTLDLNRLQAQLNSFHTYLKVQSHNIVEYYTSDGFNGGGCLKVNPMCILTNSEENSAVYLTLFVCDIKIDSNIMINITTKTHKPDTRSSPALYIVIQSLNQYRKVRFVDNGFKESNVDNLPIELIQRLQKNTIYPLLDAASINKGDTSCSPHGDGLVGHIWNTRKYFLQARGRIVEVGLEIFPQQESFLLGELNIIPV